MILAGRRTLGKISLQLSLKIYFISLVPCTSQERRTTGAVHLSERRKLNTLQVPSEGMSGTRVHPLQYWYEDSDELEQVRQNETTAHSGVGKNSGSGKISFHQN